MKNIMKSALGLVAMGGVVLASCTDIESLDINRPTPQEQFPESYAAYLQSLNDYKTSEHKIVYAWFDNSVKTPASPAQHITNVPDSVDVISLMSAAELTDMEKADIEEVRQKGTKVVYTIDTDAMQTAWDEMQKAGTAETDLKTYVQTELDKQLAYSAPFDGLILKYTGRDYNFLPEADKTVYLDVQNTVLAAVNAWKAKDENKDKFLTWQGKPQNLADKSILSTCGHIILDLGKVADLNQLNYLVQTTLIEGVPADRMVIAVSTTAADSSDKKTGYWGETRTLGEIAYWTTVDAAGYTKAGIAIYNVQNDYYATGGAYTYVKEAINIMNPAPFK